MAQDCCSPAPVCGQPVAGQPVAGQPVAGQPVAGAQQGSPGIPVASPVPDAYGDQGNGGVVVVQMQPAIGSGRRNYSGPQEVEVAIGQPVQLHAQAVGQAVGIGQATRGSLPGAQYSQGTWREGWCWGCWAGCCGFCCADGPDGQAGAQVGCAGHGLYWCLCLMVLGVILVSVPHSPCGPDEHHVPHGCSRGHVSTYSPTVCTEYVAKCCSADDVHDEGTCSMYSSQALCDALWTSSKDMGTSASGRAMCSWNSRTNQCQEDCWRWTSPAEESSQRGVGVALLVVSFIVLGAGLAVGFVGKQRSAALGLQWNRCA
eukprot:TRINITY_DN2735_c0_g1_i2.p1 TRINITY_DN2735_c0_g1~~TRINITY_DN2735_c0_g1_i2.p1  ORF type:complete len:335 (+),score=60.44 TRINITY_DN2735_c0_g1_i2:62-1006(+)